MTTRPTLSFVFASALAASVALSLAFDVRSASAYCPSYGTAAGCAVEPALGANPTDAALRSLFDKVGTGTFDAQDGPSLLPMTVGCNVPTAPSKAAPRFPCHVLYAIAQQESQWTQFCVPEAPSSAAGKPERTIVSFDCGYGIAQVTSGMHARDNPTFDQSRVASEPLYNMLVGAGVLREKWQVVQCVGDRNPNVVENWYSALWAYNGLAYQNNPNNPTYSAGRKAYDPQNGGSYPYQEKVLGWMEHPSPKTARWPAILPAYPNRGQIGTTGAPSPLTEPKCGSPTSCASTRMTNLSPCTAPVADAGAPPQPPPAPALVDAGVELEVALEAEADTHDGCACAYVGRTSTSPARAARDTLASFAALGLGLGLVVSRRRRR